jgi:hypothetical protein
VSDPYFRYRYAKRAGLDRLVAYHNAYFPDEAAMRQASVPRLVVAGEASRVPPALVVQPGEDANVPIEMTFDLLRAWQSRAGHIEYAHFPTGTRFRASHRRVGRHGVVPCATSSPPQNA